MCAYFFDFFTMWSAILNLLLLKEDKGETVLQSLAYIMHS